MDLSMEDAPPASPLPIFHDVYYSVIAPPQLPAEDPGFTEAIESLDANGATYLSLDPETHRIPKLGNLTHIIATTTDFPDYEKALERYIPVVRPLWIQRSLAKGKQEQVRQFSPDPAHFMHDVTICCADIPEGDMEAIAGGVIAMGGTSSDNLTRLVTHLIALSMDDPKVQAAVRKELKCKILIPHWFDDCLRLKRRISEEPYLLPYPKFLQGKPNRPPKAQNNEDILHAMTPTPSSIPPSSSLNSSKVDVFRSKAVLLAEDLNLSARTREAIEDIITRGGGVMAETLEAADMYVCQYREDTGFTRAVNAGKDVGSLSWLYHLIIHNRWTNPLLRLLHYPIPRYGIPGFETFKISVSNYTGFARVYLESLIKASGATFTKSMMQQNTHLITAHTVSDKCDAAREWDINITNHLWLEDSYAQNRVQSLTVNQYTHFPNSTNLGEVIGRTPINKMVIEKHFLTSADDEESIPDVSMQDVEEAPGEKPSRKTKIANTKENSRKPQVEHATPGARKRDGKENIGPETFVTPGSRASKTKALSNIHNAAQDIALYNKELKRKGGVTHGRDRGSIVATPQSKKGKESSKRKAGPEVEEEEEDEGEDEELSEEEEVEVRPGKKQKLERGEKIKVLVSMYERWRQKPEAEQPDKAKLRNLGVHVINDPSPSGFILCVPKILRTKKFACALAYGPEIISTDWLDHCLAKKEVPSTEDYPLEDEKGEEGMDFSLNEALDRAVKNRRKLLHSWQIFCTEKIPGGFDVYKDIIDTNGGTCCLFRAKTKMAVPKDKLKGVVPSDKNAQLEDELYLISGNTTDEKKLWEPFKDMARKAEMVPKIVKTEWLLSLALSQEIRWDKKWEHTGK